MKSLLGALRAVCNISSDDGEDLFAHELFIRNGKLDTKWRSRKTKSRKEKSSLLWMVNSIPKHKVPAQIGRAHV